MEEHTPGPWLYRPQEYDDCGIVRTAAINEHGFQNVICQANYFKELAELGEYRKNGTDPAEANARLIAAAPDLLFACQEFLERFDGGSRADTDYIARLMREATIKATPQQDNLP